MHKEMLELAAKAASLPVQFKDEFGGSTQVNGWWPCGYDANGDVESWWNPRKDDGDALRLAVYLDMEVTVNRVDGFTEVIAGYLGDVVIRELHGDDMYAATRLAITKAAAEIGRRMCQGH